jgi:hypothetical protein
MGFFFPRWYLESNLGHPTPYAHVKRTYDASRGGAEEVFVREDEERRGVGVVGVAPLRKPGDS